MNSLILVNLPIQSYLQDEIGTTNYNPPLGLISIGTWLDFNGYEPHILDLSHSRWSIHRLIDYIIEINPLLIGISVYTENIGMALSTAEIIKRNCPNVLIVFGGPHPTIAPEDVISHPSVDFVIRQEGEAAMLELAEAIRSNEKLIEYGDIKGLIFKRENVTIKNKLRGKIADLDLLPLPKRELAHFSEYGAYSGVVNISTSRGCPGKCIYCSATALSGATYRTRGIENIFLEIVLLKMTLENPIAKIYIVDDTFTAIPNRVIEFIALIFQYKQNIRWHCESRIDVMNEDLIEKMAKSGCVMIQYGIESGSQDVLDKIEKGMELNKAREVIDFTYRNNIIPCLSFMVGHYCDTIETMEETHLFMKEMFHKYKAEMMLSFNTPFPGTWQYINRDKLGIRLVINDYKKFTLIDPVVETENFTLADQRNIFFKSTKYMGNLTKVIYQTFSTK